MLITFELADRLQAAGSGVTCNCLDPGGPACLTAWVAGGKTGLGGGLGTAAASAVACWHPSFLLVPPPLLLVQPVLLCAACRHRQHQDAAGRVGQHWHARVRSQRRVQSSHRPCTGRRQRWLLCRRPPGAPPGGCARQGRPAPPVGSPGAAGRGVVGHLRGGAFADYRDTISPQPCAFACTVASHPAAPEQCKFDCTACAATCALPPGWRHRCGALLLPQPTLPC